MIKFENKMNGRFYYLIVTRDLVNDCVLLVIYGGRNISRSRTILYGDRISIRNEIDRLSKRRLKRGYVLIQ